MTFDDLPPDLQQRVLNARAVYDFFQATIAPRLSASAEERTRFLQAPTRYLIAAGAPALADLSDEHRASMDAVLGGPAPVEVTIECWICTKAYELLIATIVIIGVIIVEALIVALVAAISGASMLAAAIVTVLIDEVGMTIGAEVLGPMLENLATSICQRTGGCA